MASLFHGHLDEIQGRAVCGWAWVPSDPGTQVVVTVLVDGKPVVSGLAAAHRPDLFLAGVADGFRSFSLLLPQEFMDGGEHELAVVAPDGCHLRDSPRRILLQDLRFKPLPPDPTPYPVELAICAIVKNEARYVLEWIAYHRVVGVEHFLLFDNESDDGTLKMLAGLAAGGLVEAVSWPTTPDTDPQHAAYAEGIKRLRGRAKWIAFIDLDEFLLPLDTGDIRLVLRDHEEVGGLMIPWRVFGSSGEQTWRDELVIKRFRRRAETSHFLNDGVKTIARSRCLAKARIHTPILSAGSLIDEFGIVGGSFGHPDKHPIPEARRLVLNHYFGKSREEWTLKRQRGRAAARGLRSESDFELHDRNEVEDDGILRFADAVEREMARLEANLKDADAVPLDIHG